MLEGSLIDRSPVAAGVRLRLDATPKAVRELRRLVAQENLCCAWINWSIVEGQVTELTATATENEGVRLLHEWFNVSG